MPLQDDEYTLCVLSLRVLKSQSGKLKNGRTFVICIYYATKFSVVQPEVNTGDDGKTEKLPAFALLWVL